MTALERMARALARAHFSRKKFYTYRNEQIANLVNTYHHQFAEDARALLLEIREPDHDMTEAVVSPGQDRTEAVRIWTGMVDGIVGNG